MRTLFCTWEEDAISGIDDGGHALMFVFMKKTSDSFDNLFSANVKKLLIFDNIDNGSLKEHLNDPLKTPLNWRTRLQIANGVVAALGSVFTLC
ncbi:kinase family protein, putative [Medicago truncatula]|uniref:Kinase family protein, putative n=1 Tax=Medicago truncatula TaxID=3880 RepID=A0A072VTP1_MEDTR|nr:kinase family protein, putative [Medicago truncatula]